MHEVMINESILHLINRFIKVIDLTYKKYYVAKTYNLNFNLSSLKIMCRFKFVCFRIQ
jgi:hypothetical protein